MLLLSDNKAVFIPSFLLSLATPTPSWCVSFYSSYADTPSSQDSGTEKSTSIKHQASLNQGETSTESKGEISSKSEMFTTVLPRSFDVDVNISGGSGGGMPPVKYLLDAQRPSSATPMADRGWGGKESQSNPPVLVVAVGGFHGGKNDGSCREEERGKVVSSVRGDYGRKGEGGGRCQEGGGEGGRGQGRRRRISRSTMANEIRYGTRQVKLKKSSIYPLSASLAIY